jgi:hypothetical protein
LGSNRERAELSKLALVAGASLEEVQAAMLGAPVETADGAQPDRTGSGEGLLQALPQQPSLVAGLLASQGSGLSVDGTLLDLSE